MKIVVTERIADEGIEYLKKNGFEVDTTYGMAREDLLGIQCNTGGPCSEGAPAKMTLVPMSKEDMQRLVRKDPAINIASKTWIANQQLTWKTLQDYFHANADRYLEEMEATDRSGPGTLVLAPQMKIPDLPPLRLASSTIEAVSLTSVDGLILSRLP